MDVIIIRFLCSVYLFRMLHIRFVSANGEVSHKDCRDTNESAVPLHLILQRDAVAHPEIGLVHYLQSAR